MRRLGGKTLLVACNLTGEKASFRKPDGIAAGKTRQLLSNYAGTFAPEAVELEPWQAIVWVLE